MVADDLRAFIDSGERVEWTHYVLHSAAEDQTEFALGGIHVKQGRHPDGFRAR
jgi:hypothetical protein